MFCRFSPPEPPSRPHRMAMLNPWIHVKTQKMFQFSKMDQNIDNILGNSKFKESKPNPGCASKNVGNNIINNKNFLIFKNLPLIFHLFFHHV